ncbi:Uncharacterised protein at_DN1028 [Pycnogonum litorale]
METRWSNNPKGDEKGNPNFAALGVHTPKIDLHNTEKLNSNSLSLDRSHVTTGNKFREDVSKFFKETIRWRKDYLNDDDTNSDVNPASMVLVKLDDAQLMQGPISHLTLLEINQPIVSCHGSWPINNIVYQIINPVESNQPLKRWVTDRFNNNNIDDGRAENDSEISSSDEIVEIIKPTCEIDINVLITLHNVVDKVVEIVSHS